MTTTADTLLRLVHQVTAPLRNRLSAVVSRLVVDAVNDAAARQLLRVQGLADEVLDPVEHFQPGGLTHVPLAGADGVLLCVGGRRGHAVAVGVANREKRPTGLLPGETGLYCASPTQPGLRILLAADGSVELTPTAAVGVPKVTIAGNLEVTGEVAAMAASSATRVTLSQHKHAGNGVVPTVPEV